MCVLLAVLLLFSACTSKDLPNDNHTAVTDENSSEPSPDKQTLEIVKNGVSSFAIFYDPTDFQAKTFALSIQNFILNTTGAILPMRSVSEASHYEYRILIGDTLHEESDALKAVTAESSFSVQVTKNSLVLYADDMDGYLLMEDYFQTTLFSSAVDGEWKLLVGTEFRHQPGKFPDSMEFLKGQAMVYNLVYDSSDLDQWIVANAFANYINEKTGLKVKAVADSGSYQNEILIGSVNRTIVDQMKRYMIPGSYISGVYGDRYVIYSDDRFGIVIGLMKFIEQLNADGESSSTITSTQHFQGSVQDLPKNEFYADSVLLARSAYGTYGSWIDKQMASMSASDREDIALVNALIERMGNSFAVSVGSSSALHQGYVVKLNRSDYSKVTKISTAGHVLISAGFVNEYFGVTLPEDQDGYIDITAFCMASDQYSLTYDEAMGIAVVTPEGEISFEDITLNVNGYSNLQYLTRMEQFFHNHRLPEPNIPVEQTRQELIRNEQEQTYIYDFTQAIYECYGSPAILTVQDASGNSVMYVSYDIAQMGFPNGSNTTLAADTVFLKSTDGGSTWTQIAYEKGWTYCALFELDGKILIMGMRFTDGNVVIGCYDPQTSSYRSASLGFSVMGSAPTAIAVYNGRIYRAHNNAVISADITTDLLDGNNWIRSESPNDKISKAYFESVTGKTVTGTFWLEEGNMVVGPDGILYAIYRIDAAPNYGYAAIFTISADGRVLTPVESERCFATGLILFPSNQSKFMIKYDQKTDRYLSLVSITTGTSPHQRNVLALVVSKDLFTWNVVEILLVERQMMNHRLSEISHAFQYIDFTYEGDDLIFIVRESVGNSCNYHNANAITLYNISDYVSVIRNYENEQS